MFRSVVVTAAAAVIAPVTATLTTQHRRPLVFWAVAWVSRSMLKIPIAALGLYTNSVHMKTDDACGRGGVRPFHKTGTVPVQSGALRLSDLDICVPVFTSRCVCVYT